MTADALVRSRASLRGINEMIFEALSPGGPGQTAFVCECSDGGCFKPVWLSVDDYARLRLEPSWTSLADGHTPAGASESELASVGADAA